MNTPVVALTFDDGPSEWTEPLLDLLAERLCRATFFVLGCNIAGYETTIQRIAAEGHELAIHGWDHTPTPALTRDQIREQLLRTRRDLARIAGGAVVRWWRPPWHRPDPRCASIVADLGLGYCGVTVDGRDVSTPEGSIVARVVAGLADGAIVGLHDGIAANGEQHLKTREGTVRATGRILERCISVTVSELLARRRAAA